MRISDWSSDVCSADLSSVAGAGFTATIGAELAGTTQLVKTDAGTLVLTGANIYTGGTAINGGTLQIAANANLGATAGGISFTGGTLNTTATFTSDRAMSLASAGTVDTNAGTLDRKSTRLNSSP